MSNICAHVLPIPCLLYVCTIYLPYAYLCAQFLPIQCLLYVRTIYLSHACYLFCIQSFESDCNVYHVDENVGSD
jgi:hypothetical protein